MLLLLLGAASLTPGQVVSLFGQAGYPLTKLAPDKTMGEVVRGKARVWVGMAMTREEVASRTSTRVSGLEFRMEFATPRRIDDAASERWTAAQAGKWPLTFSPHLGNTVTETLSVTEAGGFTPARIKAWVDAFLGVGQRYAKAFRASYAAIPFEGKAAKGFPASARLFRADRVSFRRAIRAWGWAVDPIPGYASQGWMQPILVSGTPLWIRQATRGTKPLDRNIEIVRYDDAVAPPDAWSKAQAAGEEMPSLIYDGEGAHMAADRHPIDLSGGVSLGELRRRIEAFARKG